MSDITTLDLAGLVDVARKYADAATDANVSRARVFAEITVRDVEENGKLSGKAFYTDARTDRYGDSHPFLGAALAELVTLTPTLTLTQHIVVSGASKATVARHRAAAGIIDVEKSKEISEGIANANESEPSDDGPTASETPDFDLAALLSALDDNELTGVLTTVGLDRVRKLVNA